MALIDAIVTRIQHRKLVVYRVCQEHGLAENRVFRLLKGRGIPRPGELERLARAVGIDDADIARAAASPELTTAA